MMEKIILLMIFLIHFSSGINIHDQCDEKLFILISAKTVLLFNFHSQTNSSPSIIYQTKFNTTIENGLFNKRTNTIFLLINQLNKTYSIRSLNVQENIEHYWIEKPTKLFYSTYIYLALGQRYLYLLNNQTMLLQIFALPLTSTPLKQHYLVDLPKNQRIVNYVIDEKFQFLWILFEHIQHHLYLCQLKTSSCQLYMNIFYFNHPIQFLINWNSQQLYLYSKSYLILINYYENQTNHSVHYFNSTQQQFLTICEKSNSIESITMNSTSKPQICFPTCQSLPFIFNDTNQIHTIQRLPILSDILYCSKQRRISKIVLIILILTNIATILAVISWLAYKYFYQATLENQLNSEIIWTIEKELITYF